MPTVSEKYSKKYPLQQIESKSAAECVVVKVYCKSSANFTKALTIRVAA